MGEQELFTLAVAIAGVMIVGRAVANRLEVPEVIVMVILGVLASLIPQVPNIDLPPDLVLVLFLPPLVYNAAFFSAPRETRENAVPITALAFGATTVTILGVGWVTRLVLPDLGVYQQLFEMRLDRVRAALGDTDGDGGRPSTSGFRTELVRAQRDKLAELYRGGKISDDIRRSISRSLDLEERRGFG